MPFPSKAQAGSNFQGNVRGLSGLCAIDWWGNWHFNQRFCPLTTFSIPLTDQVLMFQAYFAFKFFSVQAIERCHFAEGDGELAPGGGWLRGKVPRVTRCMTHVLFPIASYFLTLR